MSSTGLWAQTNGKLALDYLQKEYAAFGLEATDIDDLRITDNYASPNGTRHIYVTQRLHGLPVFNAQASLHFRADRLIHRTNGLVSGFASVPVPAPAFPAQIAVSKAVNAVTAAFGAPTASGIHDGEESFSWAAVSPKPIKVLMGYYHTEGGTRLAYRVSIDQHRASADYWLVVVDAQDGSIIDQDNLVLKCSHGKAGQGHDRNCTSTAAKDVSISKQLLNKTYTTESTVVADGATYNVIPFGEESPTHVDRQRVVNPAHPVASPFGWHDTDGVPGPEFTITRGNNVYAFADRNNDDTPDEEIADGGDSLVFDFFYADGQPAETIQKAAMTQAFYINSALHDWLFQHGFDEASGNFQTRNYSGDGRGQDEVLMRVQDGAAIQGDNMLRGNANFFTPVDGTSGVMQMYVWPSTNVMSVLEPAALNIGYTTGTAQFGPQIVDNPVTALVKISEPARGCTEITNDLTGNIALVTRGDCNFSLKVFNAQEAGAVGVVICNDIQAGEERGGIINMSDGNPELTKEIPSVFISFEQCVELRNTVASGTDVNMSFLAAPDRDGDFDNGLIAHELGHGVSNRLIGGPSVASCMTNNEQMGEGWSDFFSLASTPLSLSDSPDGSESRGLINFPTGRGVNGSGIRTLPYSTDFSVNPYTYNRIITAGTAPHPLGEVWNAMLWDMYWAFTNRDGFDEDLIDGTGGNNMAVRLVIEGMKRTKCSPGFIDGRDGILAADMDLNEGANQCFIWDVFARRGLGFSARQGSNDARDDGFEAFDLSPYCRGNVELIKGTDKRVINAGEDVLVALRAISYRPGNTANVVITDEIPAGMIVNEASVRGADDFSIDGNVITFDIGDMAFEDEVAIRYNVSTDPSLGSSRSFFEDNEDSDDAWEVISLNDNTVEDPPVEFFWEQTDTTPYAGDFAWYVVNPATSQHQVLQTSEALSLAGDRPVLRFFTKYQTEAGWDAGLVEVSTNGTDWDKLDDQMVRGGYRGEVAPTAIEALRNVGSFWGDSADSPDSENNGYREIIADLSDYAGQEVFVRFRFLSDPNTPGMGWWVDNIEILDAYNYEGSATLTSDAGDEFVTDIGNFGVLALNAIIDNTNDPSLGLTDVRVFPNPAKDFVNVSISSERAGDATVQLLSIDGRALHTQKLRLLPGNATTTINTARLPSGIYVVQVSGASRVSTTKVTLR